ncbi:hypothetical protein HK101_006613 [Irineochytrium annulatum]|nr:hypothetical protein HK101_006613 [Irineochytrium annulatum]
MIPIDTRFPPAGVVVHGLALCTNTSSNPNDTARTGAYSFVWGPGILLDPTSEVKIYTRLPIAIDAAGMYDSVFAHRNISYPNENGAIHNVTIGSYVLGNSLGPDASGTTYAVASDGKSFGAVDYSWWLGAGNYFVAGPEGAIKCVLHHWTMNANRTASPLYIPPYLLNGTSDTHLLTSSSEKNGASNVFQPSSLLRSTVLLIILLLSFVLES